MNEGYLNQKLARTLRERGWWVALPHDVTTHGLPDIIAVRTGVTMFLEGKLIGMSSRRAEIAPAWVHVRDLIRKRQGAQAQNMRDLSRLLPGRVVYVAYFVDDLRHRSTTWWLPEELSNSDGAVAVMASRTTEHIDDPWWLDAIGTKSLTVIPAQINS